MKTSTFLSSILFVSFSSISILPVNAQSIDFSVGRQQTLECRAANDPTVQLSDRILAGAAGAAACFGIGSVFTPAAGAAGAIICGAAMAVFPSSNSDCDWSHEVEGDMFVTPAGDIYERTGSYQEEAEDTQIIQLPPQIIRVGREEAPPSFNQQENVIELPPLYIYQ